MRQQQLELQWNRRKGTCLEVHADRIVMKKALILLHEIYGINDFIKDECHHFEEEGFCIICPQLTERPFFSYVEEATAYESFMVHKGLDRYNEILELITLLKETYDKVYVLGFSVGATIAWRCCESGDCDGVVAVYGSRIRDYLTLVPQCPTLLLFAGQDSFPVAEIVKKLSTKEKTKVYAFDAGHGFMDLFSNKGNKEVKEEAQKMIDHFLLYEA